jgi:predicted acetyltransferase
LIDGQRHDAEHQVTEHLGVAANSHIAPAELILKTSIDSMERAPAAYALYRCSVTFDRGIQIGTVPVADAVGSSAQATRAIWRYLFDIDWMAGVTASLLPVDHPLLLLVAEPRQLRFRRLV